MKDRIVALLESLPVIEEKRTEIPAFALQLQITSALAAMHDMPGNQKVGTEKAGRQLKALAEQLVGVVTAIRSLSAEARDALKAARADAEERRKENESKGTWNLADRVPEVDIFEFETRVLAGAVVAAIDRLGTMPRTTASKGRRRKQQAQRVTKTAARIFERLTGQRAARRTDWNSGDAYGPFIEFLAALFAILGIEASAEGQARAMEKTPL